MFTTLAMHNFAITQYAHTKARKLMQNHIMFVGECICNVKEICKQMEIGLSTIYKMVNKLKQNKKGKLHHKDTD